MQRHTFIGRGLRNAINFPRTPRISRKIGGGFHAIAWCVAFALTIATAVLLAPQSAQAAVITWVPTGDTAWATAGNWTGITTPPTDDLITDIALFNSTAFTNQPNADTRSINGIQVGDGTVNTGALTISSTALSIGSGGVLVNPNAGAVTLNGAVKLGANQAWENDSNSGFTVGATITNVADTTPFTLTLQGSGNGGIALNGAITNGGATGTTALTINRTGAGAVTIATGINTFTGGVTLTAGTLNINSATALGGAASTFTINGGTINASSGAITLTANQPITIGGNFTFTGSNTLNLGAGNVSLGSGAGAERIINTLGSTLTLGGTVATATGGGTSSLTKVGAGTLILTSGGTYNGLTTIGAGNLTLGSAATLPNSTGITFSGTGTLNYAAATSGTNSISLPALTFSAGDGIVQSTWTTGGTDTMAFASLATPRTAGATGNFSVTTGTNGSTNMIVLTGVSTGAMGPGYFFNGGTAATANYAFYDATGYVRGINWAGGVEGTTQTGGTSIASATYAQTTGNISAQATGTVFTGLNIVNTTNVAQAFTLLGTMTTNGILRSGNGGTTGKTTISGGTSITTTTAGNDLVIRTDMANDYLSISTPILVNGSSGLTKSGAGLLTLSGTNTYTGVTTINGGILNASTFTAAGSNSPIGTGSSASDAANAAALVINGGRLQYTTAASVSTNRLFTIGLAGATIDNSVAGTNSFNFTSTGPLAFSGSGPHTLTLTGYVNSYATSNNTFAPLIGDGTGGATSVNRTSTAANGEAEWTLTGVNTYSGTTTLTGAILYASGTETPGVSGPLGSNTAPGAIVFNGGFLGWSGGNTYDYSPRFAINSGKNYNFSVSSGTVTLASNLPVNGTNGLYLPTGTLVLTGNNTFTGQISLVNGGYLKVSSLNYVTSGDWAGHSTGSNAGMPSSTANGAILTSGNAGGNDNGGGHLVYIGTGETTDRGINFNGAWHGSIDMYIDQSGSLSGAQGNGTNLLKFTSNINISSVGLEVLGSTTGSGELSGVISGTDGSGGGYMVKAGTGTWTFSGNNTYNNGTYIYNGTLRVASLNFFTSGTWNGGVAGAASNLGTPNTAAHDFIQLGNGSTTGQLTYTGSGETTDRVINLNGSTGGGIIDQSGTGLLKFTSALTDTTAGSKVLTLQGSTAGNGEFAGAIVNGTGTTGLTKAGTNTWSLSGVNTYTGATTVNGGTLTVSTTGTLSGTTAPLAVTNPNTGAGTDVVLNLSTVAATTTGSLSGGAFATPSSGTNTATINNGGQLFTVNQTTAGSYYGTIAGSGGFALGSLSTNALSLAGPAGSIGLSATPLAINGGSLVLDNLTADGGNNNSRLAATQAIAFNGGALVYKGSDAGASSQTVGLVTPGAKLSTVTVNTVASGNTNTLTLSGASLAHTAGVSANLINGVALGSATTGVGKLILGIAPTLVGNGGVGGGTTGNTGVKNLGIVPYFVGESGTTTGSGVGTATGTPNTFVTYNNDPSTPTGFRPLNPTDEFDNWTGTITAGADNNVRLSGAVATYNPTTSFAVNSLVIASATANVLTITDGKTLTDTSGALLFVNSNTIKPSTSTGTLAFGSAEAMITVNSGVTGEIKAPITGTGGITQSGAGILYLSGTANTFTGPVSVAPGGTLSIAGDGSLGNAANGINLNGSLAFGTTGTGVAMILNPLRTITVGAGGGQMGSVNTAYNIPGNIVGTGTVTSLVAYGAPVVLLSGNNTALANGVNLSRNGAPLLYFSSDANLGGPNSPITWSGSSGGSTTFSVIGTQLTNLDGHALSWSIAAAATIIEIQDPNNTFRFTNTIPNKANTSDNLNKTGPGTLIYTGTDLESVGAVNANGGTLELDLANGGSIVSGVGLKLGGGTFYLLGPNSVRTQTMGAVTVSAGGGILKVDSNTSGTTTLAATTITATAAGSTLNIVPLGTTPANSVVTTTSTNDATGILNPRILYNSADWAAVSTTTIGSYASGSYNTIPTLATPSGADALNSLINSTSGTAGTVTPSSNWTTSTLKITGGTSLALGSNTLSLGSATTFLGGGLLYTGSDAYSITGGTLKSLNTSLVIPDLIIQQYGTGALTIGSVIANGGTGASTLTTTGTGTVILAGNNTYTGQTYINGGVLSVGADNNLGPTATKAQVNINGGTLQVTTGFSTGRLMSIGGSGATFDIANNQTLTLNGTNPGISGGGALVLANSDNGNGVLDLNYTGGTYRNSIFINAGILKFETASLVNTYGFSSLNFNNLANFSAGTTTQKLQLFNNSYTFSGLTTSGTTAATTDAIVENGGSTTNSTFSVFNGADNTFAGVIQDGGGTKNLAFVKAGCGTLTLSGASTYTGTTTLSGGILKISGANDRLPTGTALTINGNTATGGSSGTLDLNGRNQTVAQLAGGGGVVPGTVTNTAAGTSFLTVTGTSQFDGILQDGGSGSGKYLALTKNTGGALTLTGANTYTGSTTVSSNSTLTLLGSALGTSGVSVDATGALELSRAGGSVLAAGTAVDNNGTLSVTTAGQAMGALSSTGGTGSTSVAASASLTADSIVQGTLSIGAGATVTIRETTGGSVSSVPEPGTWILIGTALLGWLAFRRRQR
jgi:fibronectin-binding autotransporter adhesin